MGKRYMLMKYTPIKFRGNEVFISKADVIKMKKDLKDKNVSGFVYGLKERKLKKLM